MTSVWYKLSIRTRKQIEMSINKNEIGVPASGAFPSILIQCKYDAPMDLDQRVYNIFDKPKGHSANWANHESNSMFKMTRDNLKGRVVHLTICLTSSAVRQVTHLDLSSIVQWEYGYIMLHMPALYSSSRYLKWPLNSCLPLSWLFLSPFITWRPSHGGL